MLWPWQKFMPHTDVVTDVVLVGRYFGVVVACTDREWFATPLFSESDAAEVKRAVRHHRKLHDPKRGEYGR